MQKRALKQLNKVTQWTNEKVFSGEKTQLSDDFTAFEKEVEVRRIGIERLHATSLPFFNQLTKVKPTADPHAPSGSSKDKILITEALGLVMISYGDDVGGSYGDGLAKYGRARCKLAMAQEEFSARLSEGYIAGMEASLASVNDYKAYRKKLESRRLTLDAAITKVQTTKKDPRAAEEELQTAQARFEETEEETQSRLMAIQEGEGQQFADLADLLDAEMEYFAKCHSILEDLRNEWPSGGNRPRAKSNASGRSAGRTPTQSRSFNRPATNQSSEDDYQANRSRSGSTASGSNRAEKPKEKRSMLPSFGSLGKKTGSGIPKTFRREKYGNLDDEERGVNLRSEDDEDYEDQQPTSSMGRARSQSAVTNFSRNSTLSVSDSVTTTTRPPPMRRTQTTPPKLDVRYVKALFDFAGTAHDELSLRVGQIIEIKSEVSADWYIGESEGRSGLFPSSYVEEYVPTPTTATPLSVQATKQRTLPPLAGAPVRRTLPPPQASTPSIPAPPIHTPRAYSYDTSDDGLQASDSRDELSDLDNEDHKQSVGLTSTAQRPGSGSLSSRPSFIKKPPPPPPSRRSASSNNLLSVGLAPPPPPNRARSSTLDRKTLSGSSTPAGILALDSSPEGSPFAVSEDEEVVAATGGAAVGNRGLSHGLGNLHLAGSDAEGGTCGTCGCEDFTQNVFKPKGTCSTCFHLHG